VTREHDACRQAYRYVLPQQAEQYDHTAGTGLVLEYPLQSLERAHCDTHFRPRFDRRPTVHPVHAALRICTGLQLPDEPIRHDSIVWPKAHDAAMMCSIIERMSLSTTRERVNVRIADMEPQSPQ
jgi:hypothetical protein